MSPKNEELLYVLLWYCDQLARPTWRNLSDPFEVWAWRNRLSRRLGELARLKLIERDPAPDLARLVRLTEAGRSIALGGRDPEKRWDRPWDGKWRLVMFDLPTGEEALRQRLLRVLRDSHFGYLQRSVWVSPDPIDAVREALGEAKVSAESFLIMEGRPAAGESDAEIVSGAWNLEETNRAYARHMEHLRRPPSSVNAIPAWAKQEIRLWNEAVGNDPLLPSALLPEGYLGRKALALRWKTFRRLPGQP